MATIPLLPSFCGYEQVRNQPRRSLPDKDRTLPHGSFHGAWARERSATMQVREEGHREWHNRSNRKLRAASQRGALNGEYEGLGGFGGSPSEHSTRHSTIRSDYCAGKRPAGNDQL
jgi:hypothetical protein